MKRATGKVALITLDIPYRSALAICSTRLAASERNLYRRQAHDKYLFRPAPSTHRARMSRVLPNLLSSLQEARLPNLHHAPTFGMEPKVWWLFFRRDLDAYGIRKMSDAQWRRALQIAVTRNIRPHKAAKEVAAIQK